MIRLLQEAVRDTGLTQIEIAARLHRPRAYLSKVLKGQQILSLVEVRDICEVAGIPFLDWVTAVDQALREERPFRPQD